jgi:SlyX protein
LKAIENAYQSTLRDSADLSGEARDRQNSGFASSRIRMDARLNELEAKLSFAEDLLDALNATVFRQQQQIDRLQQDVRALRQQVQAAEPQLAPTDEVPPHY